MERYKIKKKYIGMIFCCIGVFLFPYILRNRMLPQIAPINIIFYIGVLLLLYYRILSKPLKNENSLFWKIWIVIFFIIESILIFFTIDNGDSIFRKIDVLFANIIPAMIVFFRIKKREDAISLNNIWFFSLEIICYLITIFSIIDKIGGNIIQKMFASFYDSSSLNGAISVNRLVTFYGTPLQTAFFVLMFLLMNFIRKKENISNKRYILNLIVSFILIALTGSKSAFIVSVLMLIVFITDKKNYKYILVLSIFLIAFYYSGMLDLTLDRISMGIESGDLSTYRNIALTKLIQNGTLQLNAFRGNVFNYQNQNLIIALEYPILRWAYMYGIVFALLISITIFIYPIIKIIKTKKIRIMLGTVLLMVYLNSFDGLAGVGDSVTILAICIMQILSLCDKSQNTKRE